MLFLCPWSLNKVWNFNKIRSAVKCNKTWRKLKQSIKRMLYEFTSFNCYFNKIVYKALKTEVLLLTRPPTSIKHIYKKYKRNEIGNTANLSQLHYNLFLSYYCDFSVPEKLMVIKYFSPFFISLFGLFASASNE